MSCNINEVSRQWNYNEDEGAKMIEHNVRTHRSAEDFPIE